MATPPAENRRKMKAIVKIITGQLIGTVSLKARMNTIHNVVKGLAPPDYVRGMWYPFLLIIMRYAQVRPCLLHAVHTY